MTRWTLAAVGAVLLAGSLPGAGGTASIGDRLDRYLRAAMSQRDFNGTVLVVRGGRVLLRKGYGYADAAPRTPNRPSTRFRISSLTGDVTFLAFLQLVDLGRIGLDDSVCEHLRPCPANWRPITIRLLVSGRSGLPSARPLPSRTLTLAEWMARLRSRPLAFAAGRARDRSEAGSLVVAQLLEAVSRSPWLAYVQRNVLRPAGMASTVLDLANLARRATPYIRRRDRTLGPPASFPPLSEPDALYGLTSTVDDVCRFDVARRSGRLVSRRLLDEVARARGASARGWPDRSAHLGHGPRGTSDGWYTAFIRDLTHDLTILAFANMGGFSLSDVVQRIALVASGWPPPPVAQDPAIRERYVGTYHRWDTSQKRRITTVVRTQPDGTLLLTSDDPARPRSPNRARREARWHWTLVPTSDGAFFASGDELWWGISVSLERGATPADDVLVARFVSLGFERRYRRVP